MDKSKLIIMDNSISDIKKNIINNFLVPYYKFTSIHMIQTAIADIIKRSWFPCEYNYMNNILTIYVCDEMPITIKFNWIRRNDKMEMFNLMGFE